MKDLGWKDVNPRAMRKIEGDMERMLSSLVFIGQVEDGADWNVYSDWGCGGTFEYPSEAHVEKVVEYPVRAQQSETVTCKQAFMYKDCEYTVAAKTDLPSENALDEWLSASGYPGLEQAKTVSRGGGFTLYSDGTCSCLYAHGMIFIFSVTDDKHRPLRSAGDRTFAHLVESFRIG